MFELYVEYNVNDILAVTSIAGHCVLRMLLVLPGKVLEETCGPGMLCGRDLLHKLRDLGLVTLFPESCCLCKV